MINARILVADVSALWYPYGYLQSGGLEMIRAAKSVIKKVNTSVVVSIPSPITARLPAVKPTEILETANREFPIMPIHEAFLIIFALSSDNYLQLLRERQR